MVWCTSAGDWLAERAPSLASQLPQGSVYICRRLVGSRGVIAGRPAPTVGPGTSEKDWSAGGAPSLAGQLPQLDWVHLRKIGRLAGRHRWQASSHNKDRSTPPALHHSTGRAVARLPLLILIHLPLRNAERPGLHSHAERRERSWGGRKRLVGWPGAITAMRRSDKPAPTIKTEVHRPLFTTQQAEQ
jgi:hypothetical protein